MEKKNMVTKVIAIILMSLSVFIALFLAIETKEHYYKKAEVVEIEGDVIVVEDENGYLWEFYGDDYKIGQQVEMKMFTNYTHNIIFDDEIKKVEIRD